MTQIEVDIIWVRCRRGEARQGGMLQCLPAYSPPWYESNHASGIKCAKPFGLFDVDILSPFVSRIWNLSRTDGFG
jgi:hypothetical protein